MELRPRRRQPRRPTALLFLIAAAITAGVWAYLNGLLPGFNPMPTPTLEPVVTRSSTRAADTPSPTASVTASLTPVLTPSDRTPADQWAQQILTVFVPAQSGDHPETLDGLAWWQNSSIRGELDWVDGQPVVGDRVQDLSQIQTLSVLMPDPDNPGRLITLGSGIVDGGALSLAGSSTDSYWLLGGIPASIAIKALVFQGLERDIVIEAAFSPGSETDVQLVLLDFQRLSAATATFTVTLDPSITVTATSTATRTPSITPTRQPDPYMLDLIIPKLDPLIDSSDDLNPSGVLAVMTRHPFFGVLTWSESGPQIAGRPIAVAAANQLDIFTLTPGDAEGTPVLAWSVEFQDGTTRFLDDQIYFQERRMDEVLFWMVRHAAAQGGQLFVAYDDFGLQQNLIFLGFRPFSTPTPAPGPTVTP